MIKKKNHENLLIIKIMVQTKKSLNHLILKILIQTNDKKLFQNRMAKSY